jgi:D-alanyl-D-alanine carboxypeptidase
MRRTIIILTGFALLVSTGFFLLTDSTNPPRLEVDSFKGKTVEQMIRQIADATQEGGAPGILIYARHNGQSYSATAGVSDKETRSPIPTDHALRIASISKIYTATVILSLAQDGLIDLDMRIADILPMSIIEGLPNGKLATVRQLLMHTSGIPDYYDLQSYLTQDWYSPITLERILPVVKRQSADGEAGAGFTYSNTGYVLLGEIAELVSGKSFENLIGEIISKPLGLKQTGYNIRYPNEGGIHGYGTIFRPWTDTYDYWEHSGTDSGITAPAHEVADVLEALLDKNSPLGPFGSMMYVEMIPRESRFEQGIGLNKINGPKGMKLYGHTGDVFGYQTVAYTIPEYDFTFVAHINCSCDDLSSSLIGNMVRALQALSLKG